MRNIKVSISLILACLVMVPLSASAYNDGRSMVGGQYSETSGNFQGITVDILTNNTYTSVPNSHFTCSWSMLADYSGTNEKFAQVGFVIDPQFSYPRYFYGWATNGASSYLEVDSAVGPATGSTHTYKVEKVSSSWQGTVDGSLIASKSISMNPDSIQYYNETDLTVFMGTSSDKLKFLNPKSKNSNGSWTKPYTLSFTNMGSSQIDYSYFDSHGIWYSWQ